MAAATAEMYTRGAPGEPDNRGESLVQQHLDRMQQQKETAAMDKLRALMPQMGDMTRALALSKTEWDIDAAVHMLRSFQVVHLDKTNTLNKKRKKIREAMEACTGDEEPEDGGAKDKASSSSSSESSSSDSGSEDEEQARKKRKRSSSRKERSSSKHKKRSKESSRHRSSKHSSKKRPKDKKDKRRGRADSDSDEDKARAGGGKKLTHSEDFGKHGFIRESDADAKRSEFLAWAMDVRGANVEVLGRAEEKELFKAFVEDYNTGTLPHRKYYNLEVYERERRIKEATKAAGKGASGAKAAAAGAGFDVRADEEAMRQKRIEDRLKFQQDRLAEAYNLLKHTDRAKDMREQELLRAEMALAYKTGDRARAQKLFDRLQPDDQKK